MVVTRWPLLSVDEREPQRGNQPDNTATGPMAELLSGHGRRHGGESRAPPRPVDGSHPRHQAGVMLGQTVPEDAQPQSSQCHALDLSAQRCRDRPGTGAAGLISEPDRPMPLGRVPSPSCRASGCGPTRPRRPPGKESTHSHAGRPLVELARRRRHPQAHPHRRGRDRRHRRGRRARDRAGDPGRGLPAAARAGPPAARPAGLGGRGHRGLRRRPDRAS
jgi:hypothetical protein